LRDLDEKKPVIWTGDLNVAPTAIGLVVTRLILTTADSHPQISRTQKRIGTRLLVILKQKLRGTAISSSHPTQKRRVLKNLTNLSTFGGTGILNSVISRTSLTDLAVVEKASGGDWTTVR